MGDWTVVADTTSTALSATLSGLDEGTEYDVQVRAANADGKSDWSASGSGATDANPAGVTVSATALTVTEQDTTGDSYTVVLDTEPTHEVTVTVGGHAGTDVSPSASTLIFTTSNWDQAQTVTVTALNDDDTANDAVTVTDNDTTTPAVTLALSDASIGGERRRQHGDGDGVAGLGGGLHGDDLGGGGIPGGGRRFPPEREPGSELRRERDHEHGLGDDHGRRQRCGRGGQDRDGLGRRVGDRRDRAGDPDADPRGRRRGSGDDPGGQSGGDRGGGRELDGER